MNKGIVMLGAALACALLSARPALAANCATLSVSPGAPSIPTWNPLNPSSQEANFTATVTRASGSTKAFRLIFLDANSSAVPTRIGTASGPRYDIINVDSGATISFPSGTQVAAQNILLTQVGSNSTAQVHLKVRIAANTNPTEDFIGGTTYSETLNYALQCFKSDGGSMPGATDGPIGANLSLNLSIPKLASIVTATPTAINFGQFTTLTQQLMVTVKSTSTLNVSATTANGSQFVLAGAVKPYPTASTIPYAMSFNGYAFPTTGILTNQTRAGVNGSSFPLVLTLTGGLPSGKLAGSYSDTIILTITAGS